MNDLRQRLVEAALAWERAFGIAPSITSALSEFDAAMLIGCSAEGYSTSMCGATAVQKGHDFIFNSSRYQVKANRPVGSPAALLLWCPKRKTMNGTFSFGFSTTSNTRSRRRGFGKWVRTRQRLIPSNDLRLRNTEKANALSDHASNTTVEGAEEPPYDGAVSVLISVPDRSATVGIRPQADAHA